MLETILRPKSGSSTSKNLLGATNIIHLSWLLGLIGLWLISRPYMGIIHDSQLYVGYILADRAPETIGRDLMFTKDGQFDFTLFPWILSATINTFGISQGALLVSLASLLAWLAALGLLVRQLATGYDRWIIVIFVAVLPHWYGNLDKLSFAEPFATGRGSAEAAVIAAIALYLRRNSLAFPLLFLAIAFLLHPIMALPGFAILACFVFWNAPGNMRWCLGILATLALALGIAAAFAGLPLFDRLFTQIDPTWLSMLYGRTFLVFLTKWPPSDWARLCVQICTCLLATQLTDVRHKPLYVITAGLSLLFVGLSWVFGDLLHSLLFLEVQLWRITWFLSALAAIAFTFCGLRLPAGGQTDRAVMALLAVAWLATFAPQTPLLATATSLFALVLYCISQRSKLPPRIGRLLCLGSMTLAVLYTAYMVILNGYVVSVLMSTAPKVFPFDWQIFFRLELVAIIVCGLILFCKPQLSQQRFQMVWTGLSLLLFIAAPALWDHRTPYQKVVDTGESDPALSRILQSHPGEVLWIDGQYDAWALSGRPQWFSNLQAISAVFSRPLSMVWKDRAQILIAQKFADETLMDWEKGSPFRYPLTEDMVRQFCTQTPKPPEWIITPSSLVDRTTIQPDEYLPWFAPAPAMRFIAEGAGFKWVVRQHFAVLPCASRAAMTPR